MVAKDTAASINAFPERKKSPAPSSQAPPPKQSASGDHEREGLTLRRYTQTRKASTSLGGIANSSGDQTQQTPSEAVANQADDYEPAVNKATPETPAVRKQSSFANLASLVSNGDVVNRDRSTVNQARSVGTKLGDIAKNPAVHRHVERTSSVAATKSIAKSEAKASVDPQEAFQRALLTSQLANGKMASNKKILPLQEGKGSDIPSSTGFSSLSAIIQSRDRRSITPTINKDKSKNSRFSDHSKQ